MASFRMCPKCRNAVPHNASQCPHCGHSPQPLDAQTLVERRRRRRAVLILAPILVVAWMIYAYRVQNQPVEVKRPPSRHGTLSAQVMCQNFVKRLLVSPASAEFSHGSELIARRVVDSTYVVDGYVDSQNAFGATLRRRYHCQTSYVGGGTWRPDSVSFSPW
jgi:hypothetical protein